MSEYCANCAGVAERYEDQVDRLGKKIVQLTEEIAELRHDLERCMAREIALLNPPQADAAGDAK